VDSVTIASMKLAELAARLGAELRGDGAIDVTGVRGIEEAGPTEITFVANPKYASLARTLRISLKFPQLRFVWPILTWHFRRRWGFSTSRRDMTPACIQRL